MSSVRRMIPIKRIPTTIVRCIGSMASHARWGMDMKVLQSTRWHFVVCKDSQTSLIDSKGRPRTMGRDESTWLKGYYQFTGGFWAQSARPAQERYLATIKSIPPGAENMRVAERSYCTHTGTSNASSIRIDPFSDDEYERPSMPNHSDGSMTNLD